MNKLLTNVSIQTQGVLCVFTHTVNTQATRTHFAANPNCQTYTRNCPHLKAISSIQSVTQILSKWASRRAQILNMPYAIRIWLHLRNGIMTFLLHS